MPCITVSSVINPQEFKKLTDQGVSHRHDKLPGTPERRERTADDVDDEPHVAAFTVVQIWAFGRPPSEGLLLGKGDSLV